MFNYLQFVRCCLKIITHRVIEINPRFDKTKIRFVRNTYMYNYKIVGIDTVKYAIYIPFHLFYFTFLYFYLDQ